jgi:hypothetical protein
LESPVAPDRPVDERELRLAVLSYGSFSQAYYGLGAVVQLRKLVRASEALGRDGLRLAPSEAVFRDLLFELERRTDVRTRVTVDAVAGASAGGINAVLLAKALAVGGSLDAARALFVERGSAAEFIPGPRGLPLTLRVNSALRSMVRTSRAPLRAAPLSRWIYETLVAVDR